VGVTDDDFTVIAQRLNADLEDYYNNGTYPDNLGVIAMNRSGMVSSGYAAGQAGGQGGYALFRRRLFRRRLGQRRFFGGGSSGGGSSGGGTTVGGGGTGE